jgi:hypothetical protein
MIDSPGKSSSWDQASALTPTLQRWLWRTGRYSTYASGCLRNQRTHGWESDNEEKESGKDP